MNKETGQDVWKFPIDESRKKACLETVRQEAEKKKIRSYPSLMENMWNQLRFQTWKYWCTQGGVLLTAMVLVLYIGKLGQRGNESIAFCSVFLVLAGNLCLSSLGRLFSFHMTELEQTLYLNLKQMVCIQMFWAGIVDVIVLAVIVGFTGGQSGVGMGAYLLYMLVPFLWSDIVYLYLITNVRKSQAAYRQVSITMLCAALAILPLVFENVYKAVYLPVWGVGCLAGVIVLGLDIHRILGKIERGEDICLN